ncbi:major facilitator superfamily domain-containing protein [Plectosphaerella plurivora]|uniref:Major facilitator superfamily domain-containing protein n=1 Tax=Plectosphaerella plurivora TaxID=936078 RepID=A0A9P8VDH2_9PEZI|nr:major facilitator superfamily domain-containing protein [Plectosphaerella plurivora]
MPKPRKPEAKLPAQQLAILAIARFAEPIALTSVFPYLPEMIRSFGVEQNEVAKWAGLTSAAFSVAQSCTAVAWGRASDTFGRKITIICGLFTTMILFLVWGLSTSLPMAITVRLLLGAGNGNVGIIRTMVAEMVTERHLQPRAFSIMPLVWSIGSIFGPAFGGIFVKPAERFPSLFGNSEFFKAYPFALPNIILAVFFLMSMTTGILFLKETLESRRHRRDWGLDMGKRITRPFRRMSPNRARRTSFVDGEATAPLLPTRSNSRRVYTRAVKPSMSEVFTKDTTVGLIAYTFMALHSVAYDQVLPVFLNLPAHDQTPENSNFPFQFTGGFGLSSDRIGTIFAIYGITCGLVQFLAFPPLCTRIGALNCFRLCAIMSPFIYFFTPYAVAFESTTARYAALIFLMIMKAFASIIGFPCITILLTNSASDLRILGTLNGFATMFSGLGRAVGPAGAGAAFSWGLQRGYIITPWWFLAAVATLGAISTIWLVDGDGPSAAGSASSDSSEEDDENALLDESDDDTLRDSRIELEDENAYEEDAPLLSASGKQRRSGYSAADQRST